MSTHPGDVLSERNELAGSRRLTRLLRPLAVSRPGCASGSPRCSVVVESNRVEAAASSDKRRIGRFQLRASGASGQGALKSRIVLVSETAMFAVTPLRTLPGEKTQYGASQRALAVCLRRGCHVSVQSGGQWHGVLQYPSTPNCKQENSGTYFVFRVSECWRLHK